MKVGSDVNDDIRRAAIFREEIGWDNFLVSLNRLLYETQAATVRTTLTWTQVLLVRKALYLNP